MGLFRWPCFGPYFGRAVVAWVSSTLFPPGHPVAVFWIRAVEVFHPQFDVFFIALALRALCRLLLGIDGPRGYLSCIVGDFWPAMARIFTDPVVGRAISPGVGFALSRFGFFLVVFFATIAIWRILADIVRDVVCNIAPIVGDCARVLKRWINAMFSRAPTRGYRGELRISERRR